MSRGFKECALVEALRPSEQFFSHVGMEQPLPGYTSTFLGGKCILLKDTTRRPECDRTPDLSLRSLTLFVPNCESIDKEIFEKTLTKISTMKYNVLVSKRWKKEKQCEKYNNENKHLDCLTDNIIGHSLDVHNI